jgi:hypothetical protein
MSFVCISVWTVISINYFPLRMRSGRDEPMWVVIHKGMEAMLGISLHSYLYLKLAKTLCRPYYFLCFLFNNIKEQEGRTGSAWKWSCRREREKGESGPNNIYT